MKRIADVGSWKGEEKEEGGEGALTSLARTARTRERKKEGCYYEQVDPDGRPGVDGLMDPDTDRKRSEEPRPAQPSQPVSQVAVNLTPAATAAPSLLRSNRSSLALCNTPVCVCVCSRPTPTTPAPIERERATRDPLSCEKEEDARRARHDTHLPLARSLLRQPVAHCSSAQVVASRFALKTYGLRISSSGYVLI